MSSSIIATTTTTTTTTNMIMPFRELGSLKCSLACLGTMTMGRQCREEEAHQQLDTFIGMGGNFIDTAEVYPVPQEKDTYGITETIVGNWLSKKSKDFRRNIILATKVAGPSSSKGALRQREITLVGTDSNIPANLEQRVTPAQIRRALEASLKRLQTDYVDLYQVHWPDYPKPLWGNSLYTHAMLMGENKMQRAKDAVPDQGTKIEDIVQTMNELIKEGKIREYGVSNETSYGVMEYVYASKRLGLKPPVSIQNDFSLCDRRYETELVECCAKNNIGLLAYGPLCGGTLTGKYLAASDPKRNKQDWRHYSFPKFQPRYLAPLTFEASMKYVELAKEYKISPTELALGWCATRWYMGAVIIGGNTKEHVEENMNAIINSGKNITEEIQQKIDAIHILRPNPNVSLE
jgi:aryl-alcohol dehydrogenase-like predicted oxidoreductase